MNSRINRNNDRGEDPGGGCSIASNGIAGEIRNDRPTFLSDKRKRPAINRLTGAMHHRARGALKEVR